MKRYDFSHGGSALAGMPSRPDGEFVKYDDAQATIARLTAERDEARAEAAAAAISDTDALAEIVNQAVDAETRACADELPNCAACGGRSAILSRLDQRKEAE